MQGLLIDYQPMLAYTEILQWSIIMTCYDSEIVRLLSV
jgi:hypothetical protein